jgi:hypothetical protein
MSWSKEQAEQYFQRVRAQLSERATELRGELWDYGAKVRMKAIWPGGEWEFAKDWSVDALPLPGDVAATILREIAARRDRAEFLATLSDTERRAFEFGTWIRRLAQAEYAGRLPDAISHRSSWDRWEQHLADLSQIRPERRRAYVDAIQAAGGSSEDMPGTVSS